MMDNTVQYSLSLHCESLIYLCTVRIRIVYTTHNPHLLFPHPKSRTLAHMLDSLVRVSRWDDKKHFVRVAQSYVPKIYFYRLSFDGIK
jgi:hypothetical protein